MKTGMFGKQGKRLLAVFAALALMMSGVVVSPTEPEKAKADTVIHYMNPTVNQTTHEVSFSDATIDTYTVVTDSTNTTPITWNGGWYAVTSDVTIGRRITVSGTVNLILCDAYTLTASAGITVQDADHNPDTESPNALNIYGQSAGTGTLTIPINTSYNHAGNHAGIGSEYHGSGGNITINGGTVTANGGNGSAGIGGGCEGNGGNITINGGTVNATGEDNGAGIGGGKKYNGNGGNGGNITINGGTVNATGVNYSAGIGGGHEGNGGNINIYGGDVTATSDFKGAGIGGGYKGNGGNINIYGGDVTATSNSGGAGIGGGYEGNGGNITISGGMVTANGGSGYAKGIGAGDYNGSVVVDNGTLTLGENVKLYGDNQANPSISRQETAGQYSGDRFKYMSTRGPISYMEWNVGNKRLESASTGRTEYTIVSSETTWGGDGQTKWYVVNSNITISDRITCSGNVHLILCDGYTLEATKGIKVNEGAKLCIYAGNISSNVSGTGKLYSGCDTSGTLDAGQYYSGIGSGYGENGGTIEIHGGVITAMGGQYAAGIGDSNYSDNGAKTYIYGGEIAATGYNSPGIGGGDRGSKNGKVSILGGEINATGGDNQPGVGYGGDLCENNTVEIFGGNVTGRGGADGPGIGGKCAVTISEGTVEARGTTNAAGIGGMVNGSHGDITISGGSVTATAGGSAAGIGGGTTGDGGNITITGGTVTATGGAEGAGIGGGRGGNGGTVIISGGTVTASGGTSAEGIGKGAGANKVPGDLKYGPYVKLLGDDNSDPTTVLAEPESSEKTYQGDRKRYMKAVAVNPPSGGGESYTPYYPSADPPAPEPKFPGGEGWTGIVKEIGNTTEGGKLEIDMNGTTTLPTTALNAIQGKDIDLVLDMGNGIKWTINGKDVSGTSGDVNLGVLLGKTGIPVDVINNLTGEREKMNLMLSREGGLGFEATLTCSTITRSHRAWISYRAVR